MTGRLVMKRSEIARRVSGCVVVAVASLGSGAAWAQNSVPGLSGARIVLTNVPSHESLVRKGLADESSGYPDLKRKLQALLKNRCPTGTPVSFEVLNERYYALEGVPPSHVDPDKDIDEVRSAYVIAWKEKNQGNKAFDAIAPKCR